MFEYLKKFKKSKIIIDPNYPDHEVFDVANYDNWKFFYYNTEKMIPDKGEIPEPKELRARITVCKNADHAHDLLTRRSVTGILLFINNTPVK